MDPIVFSYRQFNELRSPLVADRTGLLIDVASTHNGAVIVCVAGASTVGPVSAAIPPLFYLNQTKERVHEWWFNAVSATEENPLVILHLPTIVPAVAHVYNRPIYKLNNFFVLLPCCHFSCNPSWGALKCNRRLKYYFVLDLCVYDGAYSGDGISPSIPKLGRMARDIEGFADVIKTLFEM